MPENLSDDVEPLESFRERLRAWLKENMPPADNRGGVIRGELTDEEELADVQQCRELQRRLYDGGFAGITFPKEYGGQGLTNAHQQVFNEEIVGYQYPDRIQVPNFQPCATVILEFGTEEQKRTHLDAIFKGEEIWMQMLSEPSGGSDVAGAQTSAIRDGDEWILNGSKIWTTGAWWSDWALCLARTNWDVPKHRGLTVFMVPFSAPGIEMHRIEMLNGSKEFCQEFLTDVRVPDSDRIGEVDDGWTVGTRWMFHEKSFTTSFYTTRPTSGGLFERGGASSSELLAMLRRTDRVDDPDARELVGEAHALNLVSRESNRRVGAAIASGKMSPNGAGLSKVLGGTTGIRLNNITWELAGPAGAAWTDDDEVIGKQGVGFLMRQAGQIGGGTVEMSRNVISERLLGMPRERTNDKDVAFREVPKGPSSK